MARLLTRSFVILAVIVAVLAPVSSAFAHQHCGTPQAEPDCDYYYPPTPVPTTPVPPTVPPATSTPVAVSTPVATSTPVAASTPGAPTATPPTPAAPPVATSIATIVTQSSSPSSGRSYESLCVVSIQGDTIHVDIVRTSDANAYLAEHANASRMPQGGDCGPTDRPIPHPTATPAATIAPTVAPTTAPTVAPTPQPTPEATLTPTPKEAPAPIVCADDEEDCMPPVVVETPPGQPNTGDGTGADVLVP